MCHHESASFPSSCDKHIRKFLIGRHLGNHIQSANELTVDNKLWVSWPVV